MKNVLSIVGAGILAFSVTTVSAQEKTKATSTTQVEKVKEHDRVAEHQQKMEERVKDLNLNDKDKEKYIAIQKDFSTKKQTLMKEKMSIHQKIKGTEDISDADLKQAYTRLNAIDVELAQLKATKFNQEVEVIGIRNVVKEKSNMGKGQGHSNPNKGHGQSSSTKEHDKSKSKSGK